METVTNSARHNLMVLAIQNKVILSLVPEWGYAKYTENLSLHLYNLSYNKSNKGCNMYFLIWNTQYFNSKIQPSVENGKLPCSMFFKGNKS